MLDKRLDNGHRARQMEDNIDRKLPFSEALRNRAVGATDIDFIGMDGDTPRIIIEVSGYDHPFDMENSPGELDDYLLKTDARRQRDHNEQSAIVISKQMQLPSMFALFMSDVDTNDDSIVHYRGIYGVDRSWKFLAAKEFFDRLRRFVHQ